MCGIFAAVAAKGTLNGDQRKFLEQATIAGQLRGMHGTGMMLYGNSGVPLVYKRALDGNDFLQSRQGVEAFKRILQHRLVIGHNRFTTSGGDTDNDCHPYQYDNVTGVHNGGVSNYILGKLDTTGSVADVDSAKIFAALDKTENPIEVLEKIDHGNYALAWVDHRTQQLNLARNGGRPMWASGGPAGLYFASEYGMLAWLMMRNNLHSKTSQLYELSEHCLYQFDLDNVAEPSRTSFKVKHQTYHQAAPKASQESATGRAQRSRSWGNSNNKTLTMRYFAGVDGGIKAFREAVPVLDWYAECIQSAISLVDSEYTDDGKDKPSIPMADVKVMKVIPQKPDKNGNVYIRAFGVLEGEEEGLPIPVQIQSFRSDAHPLETLFSEAVEMGAWPSVRVEIKSIRCAATGDIMVSGNLISCWDTSSFITGVKEDDSALQEITQSVEASMTMKDFSEDRIQSCWASLSTNAVSKEA